MSLRPYPEYKESDAPWVEDIPNHWEMKRAKTLFQKMERPIREEDNVITCFRDGVVTLRKNRRTQGFTNSLKEIGYQGIRKGDLVIHQMDAFAGAIGVSDSDGKGTPVYSVCQPIGKVNQYYYAYIVREMARTQWIAALATGIRERSTDFRYNTFANQAIPYPPPDEQDAIVQFLDVAEKRIRRYIRAKQKLIKLLNEQKQTIIQQAVTRGLNPDASMKDSGIDEIGQIPQHWDTFALKYVFSAMDYGISDPSTDSGTIPVLTMGNIKDGKVTVPESGGVTSVEDYLLLEQGDLLFNRTNSAELVGKVGLFQGHVSHVTFASYLVRMRCNERSDPEFMNYLLNSVPVLDIARSLAIPSLHQSNLNPTRYGRIVLCFPPHHEQLEIVAWLKTKLSPIENAIRIANANVEAVQEYRTRLIADVVTGKVDVRGLVFEIPEEFDDDLEDDFEDEDSLEDDMELEEMGDE